MDGLDADDTRNFLPSDPDRLSNGHTAVHTAGKLKF